MSAAEDWAQATNKRAGIPYRDEMIAELDAENARLHGELIDVQCELIDRKRELAAVRSQLQRASAVLLGMLAAEAAGQL